MNPTTRKAQLLAVVAAALGYFVDLYDIVIFGVVRVASLRELGVVGQANTDWGLALLNLQMAGMLIGGFFWGWVGDRYGRRRALIATIALYSLANIANAFVTSVEQYALLRLLAGIGLAGELGAGITLIAELLPKRARGYGTTVISFLGLVGALVASYVGQWLDWRTAYLIGGGLGLGVLALRLRVLTESALFQPGRADAGSLRRLLGDAVLRRRFVAVILVGVPIWYVSALFVNLAPEYGKALGFAAPLSVAEVLRWQALGLALGSAGAGLLSEWLASRKRVIAAALLLLPLLNLALLRSDSSGHYLALMFAIGLAQGYWTVFVTLAAEQFGTGLRATVATAVPNLVRASVLPVSLGVKLLWPLLGLLGATLALGALVYLLAGLCLRGLPETHGRELDYRD
ncbi:MAG: MFS transporter [Stagnimonas sp.]|nr:MFS transporter [Stagnimonas sp.]